jgi:hypothetical protein
MRGAVDSREHLSETLAARQRMESGHETTAAPGYIVIAVVITIMVVGLALSLWTRDTPPARRV